MKLRVTGRYVDLDFETRVPIMLSCRYVNERVAEIMAMQIARILKLEKSKGLKGLWKEIYYEKPKKVKNRKKIRRGS